MISFMFLLSSVSRFNFEAAILHILNDFFFSNPRNMNRPSRGWAHFLAIFVWLSLLFSFASCGRQPYNVTQVKDMAPVLKYELYCEFFSKTCAWQATKNWDWFDPVFSMELNGPTNDGTISTSVVAYLGLDNTTGATFPEKFTSPELEAPEKGTLCMKFSYFSEIYGTEDDGLHLYLIESNGNSPQEIWSGINVDIDEWSSGQVAIQTNHSYKLQFVASGSGGFVALKDFIFNDRYCHNDACDFESGLCKDWSVSGFEVIKASKSKFSNAKDHTTRSPFGSFVYVDMKEQQKNLVPLYVESPILKDLNSQCLTYSFMRSSSETELKLYSRKVVNSKYDVLWVSNSTHIANTWITLHHNFNIEDDIQLLFKIDPQADSTILFAIDDILLFPGKCPPQIMCLFERDFCDWQHNTNNTLHWSIGPGRVHHLEKYHNKRIQMTDRSYLYTDFTVMTSTDKIETMQLISESIQPKYQTNPGYCFRITLKIEFIDDVGDFTVEQLPLNGEPTVLFSSKASKIPFNEWINSLEIYVPNNPSNEPYRLSLNVHTRNSSTQVSIGGVHFDHDYIQCKDSANFPTSLTIPTEATVVTPAPDPFVGLRCDFEDDNTCGWKSSTGNSNFTRITGFQDSHVPGMFRPHWDHTNKMATGGYVIAYTDPESGFVDKATFTGKFSTDISSPICIDFAYFYYIFGRGSSVKLTLDNSNLSDLVWLSSPGISNQWHRVRFSYDPKQSTYSSLTFETSLVDGSLALDDIDISLGLCNETLDAKNDRICDFEANSCDFNPLFVDDTVPIWKIYQGLDANFISDHSTATQYGHFYGVGFGNLPATQKPFDQAISTQNQPLKFKQKNIQCIRFSYYTENINQSTVIFGYDIREIVSVAPHSEKSLLQWTISGSTNKLWFTHHIPVTWDTESYVSFYIQVKNLEELIKQKSKIFIDDFTLSVESCPREVCTFDDETNCFLEPVPIGKEHPTPSVATDLVKSPINSTFNTDFLAHGVEGYFHMFSPFQDLDLALFKQGNVRAGNLLYFTSNKPWIRAMLVTDRIEVNQNPSETQVCLSFLLKKGSLESYLQILMGDSQSDDNVLLYTTKSGETDDWEKIEILAKPRNEQTLDLYFYFVGTLAHEKSYLAIDLVSMSYECTKDPDNEPSTTPFTVDPSMSTTQGFFAKVFECKSGENIPLTKVCDYKEDCTDGSDEKVCGTCSFENHDLCGYQNRADSLDIEWDFNDNYPNTKDDQFRAYLTLHNDHSYDFEKYHEDSLQATLESYAIKQSYSNCMLYLEYRPNGTSINENVFEIAIYNVELQIETVIYQSNMKYLTSMRWEQIGIYLGRIAYPFLINFRGIFSSNDFDSHSIRNVHKETCQPPKPISDLTKCQGSDKFLCKNQVCIASTNVCNLQDDCGDRSDEADCDPNMMTDFSNGFGLWTPVPLDDFNNEVFRLRTSDRLSNYLTGPLYDSTNGPNGLKGFYAIMRPGGSTPLTGRLVTKTLVSIPFRSKGNCQLSLFYFTNSDESVLSYHLQTAKGDSSLPPMSLNTGSWTKAEQMLVDHQDETLSKVIISATISLTPNKTVPYIAIDDISFSKDCLILKSSEVSQLSTFAPDDCPTFKCNNTKGIEFCLQPNQLCDFVDDCDRGQDEKNCGDCDFDEGHFCGWRVDPKENLWKIQQPAYSADTGLQQVDASNNKNGGYIYGWSPENKPSTDPIYAKIISPKINAPTSEVCTFRFSHLSSSRSVLNVGIYSHELDIKPNYLFESESRTIDYYWRSYAISVGQQPKGLQLFVEGYSEHRTGSYMNKFLDNFMLVDCFNTSITNDQKVSCDFEDDICGWINILSNTTYGTRRQINWVRMSTDDIEPGSDHTSLLEPKRNHSGTWMGLNALDESIAFLRTHISIPANQEYCFTFWYYLMTLQGHGRFWLYSSETTILPSVTSGISQTGQKELFTVYKTKDRNWKQRLIYLEPSNKPRYLIFAADVSAKSVIGLDDFVLNSGNCSQFEYPGTCSFEMGTCAWSINNDDWTVESGDLRSHVTKDFTGHYVKQTTAAMTEGKMHLKVSDLSQFDHITTSRSMCVRVYYLMDPAKRNDEEDNTYVGVRIIDPTSDKTVSTNITQTQVKLEGNQENWAMLTLDFFASSKMTVEIFAQRQSNDSMVALDDIVTYRRRCETDGDCSFENDLCGWDTVGNTNGYFIRFQPNNKWQGGQYLKTDTTTLSSEGHYALFSVFNQRARGETFLSSMIRTHGETICFSFNYFAQTTVYQENALKIIFRSLTSRDFTPIHVYAPSTKLEWTKFNHTFTNVPRYFTLEIELQDATYLSDVGLDDLHLTYLPCGNENPNIKPVVPDSEKVFDCSFEADKTCNWNMQGSWLVGNFSTQSDDYAPVRDHTTGTASGRYAMAIQPNNSRMSDMISSSLLKFDQDRCLTFWYYEDGEDDYTLAIYVTLNGQERYLTKIKSKIESRKVWSLVKVDIPLPYEGDIDNHTFSLKISYCSDCGLNPGQKAEFARYAIDDIKVRPGLCRHESDYVYTFEDGFDDLRLQNIRPLSSDALYRHTPRFHPGLRYPKFDHTTGTDMGSFMIFKVGTEASYYKNAMEIVNLDSDSDGTKCVRFAYQLRGNVTLKAFALVETQYDYDYDHQTVSQLWQSKNPTPENVWTIAEFDKNKIFHHKIVLYMASPGVDGNYIAIDDLVIRNHKCQPVMNCDFDGSNYCSYTLLPYMDDETVSYNFGLMTAPATDSKWPGPKYDHSTNEYGGGYLYLTAYRNKNSSAIHRSRIISGPRDVTVGSSYCLSLYTQLNTKDLILNFSLLRLGDSYYNQTDQIVPLYTLSGVEQQNWTLLSLNLNETVTGKANQIQLIIEGIIESHSSGAIAIDDINVQDGPCLGHGTNTGYLTCLNGTLITPNKICDFVKDCEDGLDEAGCGTCDFEAGPCGWNNITRPLASGRFVLVKASDMLKSTKKNNAPKLDGKSNADGHYLLIKPQLVRLTPRKAEIAVNQNHLAFLLKRAFPTCVMSFDTYIQTTMKPQMEIKVGVNPTEAATIFTFQEKDTKKKWQKVHVHIGHRWNPFTVDISAYSPGENILAIDNVNFTDCQLPPPKDSCDPNTEFRCTKYGFCIDKDALCDFVDDCGDNTDEDQGKLCAPIPSKCNFEYALTSCSINNESDSKTSAHWVKYSPRNEKTDAVSSDYMPKVDHTLRTPFGSSFLLTPQRSAPKSLKATFSTAMVNSKSDSTCKMRFFYYIHDSVADVGKSQIVVQIRFASKTTPEDNILQTITVDNEHQQRWNKQVITLDKTLPFQVIFTGTLGTSLARIAIDDISFDFGCQTSHVQPVDRSTTAYPTQSGDTDEPEPPVLSTTEQQPEETTENPNLKDPKYASSGHGVAITIGITVPLMVIAIALGVFFWLKKRSGNGREDRIVFSLNRLSKKYS